MTYTVLSILVLVIGSVCYAQDRSPRLTELGKWLILLAVASLLMSQAQPIRRLF